MTSAKQIVCSDVFRDSFVRAYVKRGTILPFYVCDVSMGSFPPGRLRWDLLVSLAEIAEGGVTLCWPMIHGGFVRD